MATKQTITRKKRISRRRFVQLASVLGAGAGYMPLGGFSAEAPNAMQERGGGVSAQEANGAGKGGNVQRFTNKDPKTWYQHTDRQIYLGDVLDASNSDAMSVGFCRYNKGETNEWIVTYDEALIVTKGVFTVRFAGGTKTAKVGEVIFLTKGTQVVYQGEEDGTEVVYVSYPHWLEATRNSRHAAQLELFHPA